MYFDYSNARKELEERKKQESREYNFAIFTKLHPITISLFPLPYFQISYSKVTRFLLILVSSWSAR